MGGVCAAIYSLPAIMANIRVILNGKIRITGVFMKKVRFKCTGKNYKIIIAQGTILNNCSFYLAGNDTFIKIEGGNIRNTSFHCEDAGSKIAIGSNFSMYGGHIASTEGEEIMIGNDCMFSNDVEIRNGDSHSIWALNSNYRLNNAKKVLIGNHVWLCAHSRIMKGAVIPDNCVIGNSAIVSSPLYNCNSIYAGTPAKMVKTDIEWSRKRFER